MHLADKGALASTDHPIGEFDGVFINLAAFYHSLTSVINDRLWINDEESRETVCSPGPVPASASAPSWFNSPGLKFKNVLVNPVATVTHMVRITPTAATRASGCGFSLLINYGPEWKGVYCPGALPAS
jgi:hypothetical protein